MTKSNQDIFALKEKWEKDLKSNHQLFQEQSKAILQQAGQINSQEDIDKEIREAEKQMEEKISKLRQLINKNAREAKTHYIHNVSGIGRNPYLHFNDSKSLFLDPQRIGHKLEEIFQTYSTRLAALYRERSKVDALLISDSARGHFEKIPAHVLGHILSFTQPNRIGNFMHTSRSMCQEILDAEEENN